MLRLYKCFQPAKVVEISGSVFDTWECSCQLGATFMLCLYGVKILNGVNVTARKRS